MDWNWLYLTAAAFLTVFNVIGLILWLFLVSSLWPRRRFNRRSMAHPLSHAAWRRRRKMLTPEQDSAVLRTRQ